MKNRLICAVCLVLLFSCEKEKPKPGPGPEKPDPEVTLDLTPPAGHPKLYLRSEDIPALKEKVKTADAQKTINALKAAAVPRTAEEEAAEDPSGYRYYFKMRGVTSQAQLDALDYLLEGDRNKARRAITSMLETLDQTNFGTKNDLSRASGVRLMVGAVVYDWCYPEFSMSERRQYIANFKRIAGTMECGYPPKGNDYIVGHASEWMILRDLLSAGIAVYDEDPEIYNHVAKLLKEKYIPVRNLLYKGGAYHQGTSYVTVRFGNDLISQWIMKSMGVGPIYSEDMRNVAYDLIYRRRPDGQVLPNGDCNPNRRGNAHDYTLIGMLAGSFYNDPYLEYEYFYDTELEPHCLLFELLWRNYDLAGKAPDDLPLTRFYGSPYGWMHARTGWDKEGVIVEAKVGETFIGNHQHLDAGAFQIYYKGPLAIDSGTYQGTSGDYSSPHCMNYFKRTIAHNSILVYDPNEVFGSSSYGGAKIQYVANDGGQKSPGGSWKNCETFEDLTGDKFTTGREISHFSDGTFSFLKGDIAKAYSAKVEALERSFVFVNRKESGTPADLIVYDHVVSSDPSFRKYFLLHSIEEPSVSGQDYEIRRSLNGDSGMLHCTALLPQNASIEKVGGPGKEFWVFGFNYPNDRSDEANERGAWRIEVCPGSAAKEDRFLNLIQIADRGTSTFFKPVLVSNDLVDVAVADRYVVSFSRSGKILKEAFAFNIPGSSAQREILLTDVAQGYWKVTFSDGSSTTLYAKSGENVLRLTAPSGRLLLQPK